ncbi:MAG TPA: hypothetical protein VF278_23280 [Pirellulales bacterium]
MLQQIEESFQRGAIEALADAQASAAWQNDLDGGSGRLRSDDMYRHEGGGLLRWFRPTL